MMEEAILMLRKAQGNKEIQRKKCKTAMNVQASWRVFTILTIILQYTTMFWECHVTSCWLQSQVSQFYLRQAVLGDMKRDLSTSTERVGKVEILFKILAFMKHSIFSSLT